MTSTLHRLRIIAFWGVVLSAAPYLTLKVLWLAGSRIGMGDGGTDAALMQTQRFVVGNVVSIGMDLTAIVLGLALLRPWGRRVPAWMVFLVAGPATGLLTPFMLGLPVGSVIQLALGESLITGGEDNLEGWVFGVIYGGFGIMALGLAILLSCYAMGRWDGLITTRPRPPRRTPVLVGCGIAILGFALAMAWWGLAGPGTTGPAGMDSVSQRTVLVVTAGLSAAGFVAPLLNWRTTMQARLAWLCTWAGCATTALQGPAALLLAHDGQLRPAGVVLTLLATPAAIVYWLAAWRRGIENGVAIRPGASEPSVAGQ